MEILSLAVITVTLKIRLWQIVRPENGVGKAVEKEKIRILIVDDEEQFLQTAKKTLQARNFQVITASTGKQAVEAARRYPVDVALVDLKMPGMNGEQILETLKKEHKWMEVIILTGYGSIDSAVECTKKGAFSYLQKPCSTERLISVLTEAYERRAMNKMKAREEDLKEIFKTAGSDTPLYILRKIKLLNREGE